MIPGTLSKLVCRSLNITNHVCFKLERKINLHRSWGTMGTSSAPCHFLRSLCFCCFSLLVCRAPWGVGSQCQGVRSFGKLHMCWRLREKAEINKVRLFALVHNLPLFRDGLSTLTVGQATCDSLRLALQFHWEHFFSFSIWFETC
jgi:hypothetical protein